MDLFRSKSKQRNISFNQVSQCRPLNSNLIYYSIVLLYTGSKKDLSEEIRSFFYLPAFDGFRIIKVKDHRIHQWLATNERGIEITELPVFLIARERLSTILIHENQAEQVKTLILKLRRITTP
jgi:hypothetical protein